MRMRKKRQPLRPWLPKKAERGFHGYAIATIAFYGPTEGCRQHYPHRESRTGSTGALILR